MSCGRRYTSKFGTEWPFFVIRAVKMNLANEGLEARKKDEEVAQKKRKAEEDKTWEGTLITTYLYSFSARLHLLQKHANNVSTVGAVSLIPPRRRRKPKPLSLDNIFTCLFFLTSLPPLLWGYICILK